MDASSPILLAKNGRIAKDDEGYTPRLEVIALYKIINSWGGLPPSRVWCPFDSEISEFVIVGKELGYEVIYDTGDFLLAKGPVDALLISNVPFSLKAQVISRLEFEKKSFLIITGLFGTLTGKSQCKTLAKNKWSIGLLTYEMKFWRPFKKSGERPFGDILFIGNHPKLNSVMLNGFHEPKEERTELF